MSWWGGIGRGNSVYSSQKTKSSGYRRRPKGGIDTGTVVTVELKLYERKTLKGRGETALVQYVLQHPVIEGMRLAFTCRREQLQDALGAIVKNKDDIQSMGEFKFESFGEILQVVTERGLGMKLDDNLQEAFDTDSVKKRKEEPKPRSLDPWSNIEVKGED